MHEPCTVWATLEPAMVDRYTDIPHINNVLPSSTPWCFCVLFGVICIVKCDNINEEQGWLSSVYVHAHFVILFLQVIHVIINVFCIQHS
jgi:hypothetical protein